ncbi:MAG: glycerate kinase, partial [Eggerthellaceae bacterium]|nr:glycerate kinase [Eggerthellaceae bacterium]
MKFVFASDSFKGTLSSARICQLLEQAVRESFPTAECVSLPIADGGEGTLDAIASVKSGQRVRINSHDGLMRSIECDVFVSGDSAFVEAAQPCGLALLDEDERNPLATSSYGVGECIAHVLDAGCKRITIGLGGSCTNDGGMGCLRALGARFFDRQDNELPGRGADLAQTSNIDISALRQRIADAQFSIMGDVRNPLLGPNGATYVFGPQKGADTTMLEQLESGMRTYANAVQH